MEVVSGGVAHGERTDTLIRAERGCGLPRFEGGDRQQHRARSGCRALAGGHRRCSDVRPGAAGARPLPGVGRAGNPLRHLPRRAAALRPQRQRGGVLRFPRGRRWRSRSRAVAGRAPRLSPAGRSPWWPPSPSTSATCSPAPGWSSTPCSGTRRRWASGCRGRATSRSRSSPRRRCCSGGWRCGAALAARRSTGSSRCSPSPSWSWRRHRGAATSAPRSRVPRPSACSRGCSSDAGSASAPSSSSVRCSWWRACRRVRRPPASEGPADPRGPVLRQGGDRRARRLLPHHPSQGDREHRLVQQHAPALGPAHRGPPRLVPLAGARWAGAPPVPRGSRHPPDDAGARRRGVPRLRAQRSGVAIPAIMAVVFECAVVYVALVPNESPSTILRRWTPAHRPTTTSSSGAHPSWSDRSSRRARPGGRARHRRARTPAGLESGYHVARGEVGLDPVGDGFAGTRAPVESVVEDTAELALRLGVAAQHTLEPVVAGQRNPLEPLALEPGGAVLRLTASAGNPDGSSPIHSAVVRRVSTWSSTNRPKSSTRTLLGSEAFLEPAGEGSPRLRPSRNAM